MASTMYMLTTIDYDVVKIKKAIAYLQWPSNQLGYKDSNLEMTESESVALPFGDSPMSRDKCYYKRQLEIMQAFFYKFFCNGISLYFVDRSAIILKI